MSATRKATERADNEKPPTQRALIEAIAVDVAYLQDRAEQQDSRTVNTTAPAMTEARALGICLDTLAELEGRERSSRSHNYSTLQGDWYSSAPVDRILRHLAARFGVALIETREQPCSRKHVDSLDDFALRQAIEAAAR